MKCMIVLSCLLAIATANPQLWGGPLAYSHGFGAPGVTSHQYHAQDELGQYSYGYAGGPSAKHETKTFDGITRGGYSYIDGYGLVQSAAYVSDPLNGFRVAATNLPVAPAPVAVAPIESPDVIAAKSAHFAAHAEATSRLLRAKRGIFASPVLGYSPRSFGYSVNAVAPLTTYGAHPLAYHHAVGVPTVANKYHAQDALGQYSYGYADGLSTKHESRSADGITHGGYSYLDSHGIVQSVKYTADGLGFRVAATNLP